MLKLFNTMSRQVHDFTPIDPNRVTMYACGPTVYDYSSIGNLSKYIGDDLLRRVLEANGYTVEHVMNITDVGHLESDADEGEDKLEKGAKAQGRTVWEVAKFFEEYHFKSSDALNIWRPSIVARATEHVQEMVKLIQRLEEKGFTYRSDSAIYFDTSKFPSYTKLSRQKLAEKETGARVEVVVDQQKKNPADFVLWFFTVGHFANHTMRWNSPWGEGFPGWHIECSAMSMLYLGNTLDIHTGGIDHIPVHHTNEIAQSEAATGEEFVRFWVHHRFILVEGEKMSKSKKNVYTIDDLVAKGFDPLALRYLFMTAHYRDPINFTWNSLEGAQNALSSLREASREWDKPNSNTSIYYQKFLEAASNDLNTPQAIATMWEMVKSNEPPIQKAADLLAMDKILGLGLNEYIGQKTEVPTEVQELVEKRERARGSKDFAESDRLRHEIKKLGFDVQDTSTGPRLKKL